MLFGSCSRDSEASDPLMSTSEDNAEVSAMFDDIDAEADDAAAIKLKNTPADSNTYRTIEDTLINDTLFITVTYKNWQNPSSNNVRIKNGDILIRIYGGYASDSLPYFKQITFKNFTINGNKIEGIRTIEKDPENNKVYHITLTNGKVTFLEDNTTYTRSTETRTRTWVCLLYTSRCV